MANIPSVAKRARQADKRRVHNAAYRAKLRTAKKNFLALLAVKDVEGIKASAPTLLQLLDKMVTKGIIHKNNAARNKSRAIAKAKAIVPDLELPKLTGLKVATPAKVTKAKEAEKAEPKVAAKKAEAKKTTAKKASTKKATESKTKAKKTSKPKEDK